LVEASLDMSEVSLRLRLLDDRRKVTFFYFDCVFIRDLIMLFDFFFFGLLDVFGHDQCLHVATELRGAVVGRSWVG